MTPFSASIVLYEDPPTVLAAAIRSTLATPGLRMLHLIDNSRDDSRRSLAHDVRIAYEHVGDNVGFGAGHNRAIARSDCTFHGVINPDVEFAPEVIPALIDALAQDRRAAFAGPALSSQPHQVEHWCRAQPTPFDLIARRFLPVRTSSALLSRQSRFERHDLPRDRLSEVDILSGAFLVCRTSVLRQLGGFDPRYFLYLEDYDLCRSALAAGYRCLFDPRQLVIHRRGAHSYNSLRPLVWHMRSAISYFNKWGWRPLY